MPILAVYLVVTAPSFLPSALAAARGHGTVGLLHVTARDCEWHRVGGEVCTLRGTFVAADGRTRLPNASLDADPDGASVGDDVHAVWEGERNPNVVYIPHSPLEFVVGVGLVTASVVGLMVWAATIRARLQGRRPWRMFEIPRYEPIRTPRDRRAPDKRGHESRRRRRRKRRARAKP
jgi:hypothetical protein